ncbi:MAG: glycosyltransferase family 1 protein [Balneolaceae bacterium]|nr:glycosyltransferase family 1 protein [Balneolaceae bacterium]
MSDLRVALFTGNYNHIRDGVSLTLNRLVRFLEEEGVPVLVFGPTVDEPAIDHEGEFVPVPSLPMPGRPEYRVTVGFPERAQKRLRKFGPTLVHLATPDLLGFRAMRWAQSNDIQIVASYHTHFTSYLKYYNMEMLEMLGWKYLNWFYSQCKHIYVPSPSMAEELNVQDIEEGIRIWARGVNTEYFSPEKRDMAWRRSLDIGDDQKVVTFVSRLVWEKDLQTFVDVVERVISENGDVTAMVVGDGPARKELEDMLPEARFPGYLTGEDLSRAYASSDIFLFPSDTETFGNVTLEAMSCGLPCVVADATGSKSLVEAGVNGFLAPPRDTRTFSEHVSRLVKDDELRERMGRTARQKALPYAWERVNARLLENYREALQEPRPQLKF